MRKLTVFYDDYPLCRTVKHVIQKADWLQAVTFVGIRTCSVSTQIMTRQLVDSVA